MGAMFSFFGGNRQAHGLLQMRDFAAVSSEPFSPQLTMTCFLIEILRGVSSAFPFPILISWMKLLLTHFEREIGNRVPFSKFISGFEVVKYLKSEFHQLENDVNEYLQNRRKKSSPIKEGKT